MCALPILWSTSRKTSASCTSSTHPATHIAHKKTWPNKKTFKINTSTITLPDTNIAHHSTWKWATPKGNQSFNHPFSCAMLVSASVKFDNSDQLQFTILYHYGKFALSTKGKERSKNNGALLTYHFKKCVRRNLWPKTNVAKKTTNKHFFRSTFVLRRVSWHIMVSW